MSLAKVLHPCSRFVGVAEARSFELGLLAALAARIHVRVYLLFLQLTCLNSISFRQNPFKLSEMSDSSKIAREPTPFGQENSYSRDI